MNDAGDVRRCLTRKEDNPGELGQRLGDATAAWGRPANKLLFWKGKKRGQLPAFMILSLNPSACCCPWSTATESECHEWTVPRHREWIILRVKSQPFSQAQNNSQPHPANQPCDIRDILLRRISSQGIFVPYRELTATTASARRCPGADASSSRCSGHPEQICC